MSTSTFSTRFQFFVRTAAEMTASNDLLLAREFAFEGDTGRVKLGPGLWNDLAYYDFAGGPAPAPTLIQSRWTFTDFLTLSSPNGWHPWVILSTGSASASVLSGDDDFGVVRCASGAAASHVSFKTYGNARPQPGLYSLTAVYTPVNFTDVGWYVGWHTSQTATAPTSGHYFQLVGAIFEWRAMKASVLTVHGTTYTPTANTKYWLETLVMPDGSVRGRILDSAFVQLYSATIAAASAPALSESCSQGISGFKTSAGAVTLYWIDFLGTAPSKPVFAPA